MTRVLLLSGGIDSTCVAAWLRPEACLYLDYGQRPARAEAVASARVAQSLQIPWHRLTADCSEAGSGLMAAGPRLAVAPTPEWWPFRNQLLLTLGAAWAVRERVDEILVGAVAGDGARHRDGTAWFYEQVDVLVSGQEGGVRVRAPALDLDRGAGRTSSPGARTARSHPLLPRCRRSLRRMPRLRQASRGHRLGWQPG